LHIKRLAFLAQRTKDKQELKIITQSFFARENLLTAASAA